MDNVIIKKVETHKHLGLTISEDGNWNEHVKNIMIKMSSRLSVFRRVKFKLKRSHLQTIYISFISSLMEYDDIVCDTIPDLCCLISWWYVDVFQIFGEVLGNSNNQENLYGTFRDILEFVFATMSLDCFPPCFVIE
jgi:hypothetical protein